MKETLYLNSINYQRAQKLQEQVGGNSALYRVLDAIIFCWQNSNYQEEGRKIACPKLSRLGELASMSVSSVKRQIKKLRELGFIGTKIKKVFNGSTRCFFWVYDIVFDLLGKTNKKEAKTGPQVNSGAEWLKLSHSSSSIWTTPIYKVKNNKEKKNNNYSIKQSVNLSAQPNDSVDVNFQQVEKEEIAVNQVSAKSKHEEANKPTEERKATDLYQKNAYRIEEKLTKRQIAIINGAINNTMKDGVIISNPKQLKAEVTYKISQKHPDAGGDNLQHQINSALKLIRTGQWTTPHGFYKYSDVGRKVAQKRVEVDRKQQTDKLKPEVPTLPDQFKDLFKLDLSGVGQDSETASVNDQCDGTTVYADTPSVSGNVMTVKGQPATESTKTGTIKMSQGGTVLMSRGALMGLSKTTVLSGEEVVSVTATEPQSRVDALNTSIARCQARLAMVTGEAREALVGVIQRLLDELRSLSYACVS